MDNLNIDISLVCETWLNEDNKLHKSIIERVESSSTYRIIKKDRRGKRGGGVMIVWNSSKLSACQIPVQDAVDVEVVCVLVELIGFPTSLVFFSVYVPPQIDYASSLDHFVDVVAQTKTKFPQAKFVIGGDFNRFPVDDLLLFHPELSLIPSPPTRGQELLDLCFTDLTLPVKISAIVVDPVMPDIIGKGVPSDHLSVVISFTFPMQPKRSTKITTSRPLTQRVISLFMESMSSYDCERLSGKDIDEMVLSFDKTVQDAYIHAFPSKSFRSRPYDKPWMNNNVLDMITKRKKVYHKEGRSFEFLRQKKLTETAIKHCKHEFYNRKVDKLLSTNPRSWFRAVKSFDDSSVDIEWSPLQLNIARGKDESQVVELLAEHFSAISQLFVPIDQSQLPSTFNFRQVTPLLVKEKFLAMSSSASCAPGDLPMKLLRASIDALANPISKIFNAVLAECHWPLKWKEEVIITIPKKNNATELSDTRNIAITPFWSKVLESFIFDWTVQDIQPNMRNSQFGGFKGAGSVHALVQVWDGILRGLDSPENITSINSFDLSKAFNRGSHIDIINSYKRLGLDPYLIKMNASFLANRSMIAKLGSAFSLPRSMPGGSPQGCKLGQLAFIANVDDIVDGFSNKLLITQFVDDISIIEVVPKSESTLHLSTSTPIREAQLRDTQDAFNKLQRSTSEKGHLLNSQKTSLLLFNTRDGIHNTARLLDPSGGPDIHPSKSIKLLGFTFDAIPDAGAHVRDIVSKASRRLWLLRQVCHVGIPNKKLVTIYTAFIRSLLEYASPVYHPMLTQEQSHRIERVQKLALAAIFGYGKPYSQALSDSGLLTLEKRRGFNLASFASKSACNPRFLNWFSKTSSTFNSRTSSKYLEENARTARLYNSPLFKMRRVLNSRFVYV